MSNEQIKGIEESIKHSKKLVDLGDSLERLRNNRDFKKIILDGYMEQECIRLVHLKSEPTFQTAEHQASIVTQMDGIGSLFQYLNKVLVQSNMAVRSIASDEAVREEILAEELSND